MKKFTKLLTVTLLLSLLLVAQVQGKTKKNSVIISGNSISKHTIYVAKGKKVSIKGHKGKKKIKLSFKVKQKAIASVKKGIIKGKKLGKTTVLVKSGKAKKKYTIKVTPKVTKISIPKQVSIEPGKTKKLKAKLKGKKGYCKKVIWISSNKKVVKVSSNGTVKGIHPGKAIITAKTVDGTKKKATCQVIVKNPIVSTTFPSREVLDSTEVVRITLKYPQKLSNEDVKVFTKTMNQKKYEYQAKISGVITKDQKTYDIFLHYTMDSIYLAQPIKNGNYVYVDIPKCNTSKEARFLAKTSPYYMVYSHEVNGASITQLIEFPSLQERKQVEIYQGELPKGLSLTGSNHDTIWGSPQEIADNRIVTFKGTDELGNVAYTKVNFIIGSKTQIIPEKNIVIGAEDYDRLYAYGNQVLYNDACPHLEFFTRYKASNSRFIHIAGGSTSFNAELLNVHSTRYEVKTNTYGGITLSFLDLLPPGTNTIQIKVTDKHNKQLSTIIPVKFVVAPICNLNVSLKGDSPVSLYLYNWRTGITYSYDSCSRTNNKQDSVFRYDYLPTDDYMIYYKANGQIVPLEYCYKLTGSSNIEYTLPKTFYEIKGQILDKNGKPFEGSLRLYIYDAATYADYCQSYDDSVIYEIENYSYSSDPESGKNQEKNKMYGFIKIPNGTYVIRIKSGFKYIDEKTVTVHNGNTICNIQLPIANIEN